MSMPPGARPEVVHQAGEKLYERLHAAYRAAGMPGEVVPFIDDIARRYAWCDVLVCRSGAITVAEITAAGLAAILFPLPWFVVDEQTANARFLADRDAGIALEQLGTSPESVAELLRGLTRERLAAMAHRGGALGHPDAACTCADACQSSRSCGIGQAHHFSSGIGGSGRIAGSRRSRQPRLRGVGFGPRRERSGGAASQPRHPHRPRALC
jgi:UDP-N-acetylglucosamine--N-acetylmuramyl-(pentapeptide) pyrophosphoryl-undecaprenol N-acetylglucosamine transferase